MILSLVSLLVWVVVIGLFVWLAWWFINFIALPAPFNMIARVIFGVICFLLAVYLLLDILPGVVPLSGYHPIR